MASKSKAPYNPWQRQVTKDQWRELWSTRPRLAWLWASGATIGALYVAGVTNWLIGIIAWMIAAAVAQFWSWFTNPH